MGRYLVNINPDISKMIEGLDRQIYKIAKDYYNNVALSTDYKINLDKFDDLSDYKHILENLANCSDCYNSYDKAGVEYQVYKLINSIC